MQAGSQKTPTLGLKQSQRQRTHLSSNQINELNTKFGANRKQTTCPNCNTAGRITKNGVTHDAQRQPMFQCQQCKKRLNHDQILAALEKPTESRARKRTKTGGGNENEPTPSPAPAGSNVVPLDAEIDLTNDLDLPSWADQMIDEDEGPIELLTFEHHTELPPYMKRLDEHLTRLTNRVNKQDRLVAELQRVTNQLAEKTHELAQAQMRIDELEQENAQLRGNPTPSQEVLTQTNGSLTSKYAPPMNQHVPIENSKHHNPWFQQDRLHQIKKSRPKLSPAIIQRRQQAAARAFIPPSETHGFCITYFPNRSRIPTSQTRAKLRTLGIDNSRILDIHYPDRRVVGFLTHNDFVEELAAVFEKHGIKPITGYNPCDPKHLRDPKLQELSEADKQDKALELQHNRILHAIDFIRSPVKMAIAYDFRQKQLISEEELQCVRRGEKLVPKSSKHPSPDDLQQAAEAFKPNEDEDEDEDMLSSNLDNTQYIASPTPHSAQTPTNIQ